MKKSIDTNDYIIFFKDYLFFNYANRIIIIYLSSSCFRQRNYFFILVPLKSYFFIAMNARNYLELISNSFAL